MYIRCNNAAAPIHSPVTAAAVVASDGPLGRETILGDPAPG